MSQIHDSRVQRKAQLRGMSRMNTRKTHFIKQANAISNTLRLESIGETSHYSCATGVNITVP